MGYVFGLVIQKGGADGHLSADDVSELPRIVIPTGSNSIATLDNAEGRSSIFGYDTCSRLLRPGRHGAS